MSSHLAVWMTSPANSCTPSMSGSRGWERNPVAVSRKRVVWLPVAVVTTQWRSSSSQRAPSTTTPKRMCRRRSYLSATCSAYRLSSAPRANQCSQWGLGSKE